MAKTNVAVFAQDQKPATAVTTAACTGITTDTPTNTQLLYKAGPNGAIASRLTAMPRGTVTASGLLLFSSVDNGTTKRLFGSATMPAQSVTTTGGIAETQFSNYNEARPMRLAPNEEVHVGNQVALAAGVVWRIEATDF